MSGWEKVLCLVENMREQLKVDEKKEELRKAFVEEFGIKPQFVDTENAIAEYEDSELPESVRNAILNLLRNVGYETERFTVKMQVHRSMFNTDYDWKVETCYVCASLCKRKNGFVYNIAIYPEYGEV